MLQTFWMRMRLRECYMTESFEALSRGCSNTLKSCNNGCSHFQGVFLRGKKTKSDRFQAPGGLGSILSSSFHPVSHLLYLWQLPASLHRLPEARKSDLTARTAAAKTVHLQPVNMVLHLWSAAACTAPCTPTTVIFTQQRVHAAHIPHSACCCFFNFRCEQLSKEHMWVWMLNDCFAYEHRTKVFSQRTVSR